MAPTITRLVLSLALIVAAPVVYTITFVMWMELVHRHDEEMGLLMADLIVGPAFALGWLAIWFFEIRWTAMRAGLTVVAFAASAVASVVFGTMMIVLFRGEELGFLFGGMLFVVLWLFSTALVWMELPGERRRRLASVGAAEVACPTCGYNLKGLKTTACPECGASFTIDQLFASHLERRKKLGEG